MITVRDLIRELLEFNLDATVTVNGLYDESENVNLTWIERMGSDSKKDCVHVFIETDNLQDKDDDV